MQLSATLRLTQTLRDSINCVHRLEPLGGRGDGLYGKLN